MIFDNYIVVNYVIVVILDVIFVLLTILLFKNLLKRNLRLNEITLIVLFFTISYSLLLREAVSDIFCLNCFILSTIFIIKYLESRKLRYLVLCCFFVSVTAYFRYAYLAALFVIPEKWKRADAQGTGKIN